MKALINIIMEHGNTGILGLVESEGIGTLVEFHFLGKIYEVPERSVAVVESSERQIFGCQKGGYQEISEAQAKSLLTGHLCGRLCYKEPKKEGIYLCD